MRLENPLARRVFLEAHCLAEAPTGPAHGDALVSLITRLGFVQLDSIRTVERAHDMILFARRQSYRPAFLWSLLHPRRDLFEHWTHDAAVLPMAFYRHWHMRFDRDKARMQARLAPQKQADFQNQIGSVLDHIRDQGACGTAAVGLDEPRSSGGWWDWNPSKTALDFLWRSGVLSVHSRQEFRKIYDLVERVVPGDILADRPPQNETRDWLCSAALERLGFATAGEIAAFWDTLRPAEARDWLEEAEAAGRVVKVDVQNHDGSWRACFMSLRKSQNIREVPAPPNRLRVLSPFDPALRDRKRAERLFGFHYRIEVFVPAAQRKYGYYVFPLLEGARLVGRIDMKADRKNRRLIVRAVWPERGVRWGTGRHSRLEAELDRVVRFAGLDTVSWEKGWLREA